MLHRHLVRAPGRDVTAELAGVLVLLVMGSRCTFAQSKYTDAEDRLRIALAKQPFLPNGPSSEELASLFEKILSRYPKASAIGFATIPDRDEGGLSLAAVNRMIEGAVRGVKTREARRPLRMR